MHFIIIFFRNPCCDVESGSISSAPATSSLNYLRLLPSAARTNENSVSNISEEGNWRENSNSCTENGYVTPRPGSVITCGCQTLQSSQYQNLSTDHTCPSTTSSVAWNIYTHFHTLWSVNDVAARDVPETLPDKKIKLAVFPVLLQVSLGLEIPMIWSFSLENWRKPTGLRLLHHWQTKRYISDLRDYRNTNQSKLHVLRKLLWRTSEVPSRPPCNNHSTIQGRRNVWKSGGTSCNVVGIMCPSLGSNRFNWRFFLRGGGYGAPGSDSPCFSKPICTTYSMFRVGLLKELRIALKEDILFKCPLVGRMWNAIQSKN